MKHPKPTIDLKAAAAMQWPLPTPSKKQATFTNSAIRKVPQVKPAAQISKPATPTKPATCQQPTVHFGGVILRGEFNALSNRDKSAFLASGGKLTDKASEVRPCDSFVPGSTISRAEFNNFSPRAAMAFCRSRGKLTE